ncbi:MAG: type II toxin-antitoxin system RelE/ParE family toxin [Deltaproteobacteria bacterium]|nr:type II toxin-antitoxin system RelE/ParE family toxin [Deltaproteobacteria bacterium]
MGTKHRIRWAEATLQDVESILNYIAARDGFAAASHVHDLIIDRAEKLVLNPERGRLVPELRSIGIIDFRELIESPYRICYRVSTRREVVIVSVLDGRRDLERILIDRAMGR